jgi:hypothetical protein
VEDHLELQVGDVGLEVWRFLFTFRSVEMETSCSGVIGRPKQNKQSGDPLCEMHLPYALWVLLPFSFHFCALGKLCRGDAQDIEKEKRNEGICPLFLRRA